MPLDGPQMPDYTLSHQLVPAGSILIDPRVSDHIKALCSGTAEAGAHRFEAYLISVMSANQTTIIRLGDYAHLQCYLPSPEDQVEEGHAHMLRSYGITGSLITSRIFQRVVLPR